MRNVTIETTKLVQKIDSMIQALKIEAPKAAEKAGRKIAGQASRRFNRAFNGKAARVAAALSNLGIKVVQDDKEDFLLIVGSQDELDRLTRLPATVVTGSVYHLWRILHAGIGARSDSEDPFFRGQKKSGPYPVQAIVQTSALEKFPPGRYGPFPELLVLDGNGVKVIFHPGAEGKDFLLRNGDIFLEDREVLAKEIDKAISRVIQKFNQT